jgi:3',5'-cyclic AMP phosphodiesterase CpdA
MRLIVTADLHYNHPRSRASAVECIEAINRAGGDALLLVGDTAVADGTALEECLGLFRFDGPKLFVAGNHELWTSGPDSHALFTDDLPRRVRALGWHWLQTEPFVAGTLAIVGSIGWYDYSFAPADLGIPHRFYAAKTSPGAASHLGGGHLDLLSRIDDISPRGLEIVARWNDGRFIKLGRSDEQFLDELLAQLEAQLAFVSGAAQVVAAIHHVPLKELLPPVGGGRWDFAKAYLGSPRLGELVRSYRNVKYILCGHSHMPAQARLGPIQAINVGSGYRSKSFHVLDLPT